MKTSLQFSSILLSISLALGVTSCGEKGHDDHDHDHAGHDHSDHSDHDDHDDHEGHEHGEEEVTQDPDLAGPNGGRVLANVEPRLEFLVTDARTVEVRALNAEKEAQPITGQSVSVIGGDRSNPTQLTFTNVDGVLVSDQAFPQEGNDFPVVVQVSQTADADKVVSKFNLNLSDCPTCDFREYACICSHDHAGDGE